MILDDAEKRPDGYHDLQVPVDYAKIIISTTSHERDFDSKLDWLNEQSQYSQLWA